MNREESDQATSRQGTSRQPSREAPWWSMVDFERDNLDNADAVASTVFGLVLGQNIQGDETARWRSIAAMTDAMVDRVTRKLPVTDANIQLQYLTECLGDCEAGNRYNYAAACRRIPRLAYVNVEQWVTRWRNHFRTLIDGYRHLCDLEKQIVEHVPRFMWMVDTWPVL